MVDSMRPSYYTPPTRTGAVRLFSPTHLCQTGEFGSSVRTGHREMAGIRDRAAFPGRIKGGHLTPTEIFEALRKLTATERLTLLEAALQRMCEDLQQMEQPLAQIEQARQ